MNSAVVRLQFMHPLVEHIVVSVERLYVVCILGSSTPHFFAFEFLKIWSLISLLRDAPPRMYDPSSQFVAGVRILAGPAIPSGRMNA